MKEITIKRSWELPNLEEIEGFEKSNNIKLPKDFVDFLMKFNAIDFYENYYKDKGKTIYINGFYPFGEKCPGSLQSAYRDLNGYFENKYIAFADDSGGWQYVISIQEIDYGKIYFCRMDEELPSALTLIATSFIEFIDGLSTKN